MEDHGRTAEPYAQTGDSLLTGTSLLAVDGSTVIGSITHVNYPSLSPSRPAASVAELRREIRTAQPLGDSGRVLAAARDLAASGPEHHDEAVHEVAVALDNRRITPEHYLLGAEILVRVDRRFHGTAAGFLWRFVETAPEPGDRVLGLRALLVLGESHYAEGLRRYPGLAALPPTRPQHPDPSEDLRLLEQRAEAERAARAEQTTLSPTERLQRWRRSEALRRAVMQGVQDRRPDWPAMLRCAITDPGHRKRLVKLTDYLLREISPREPDSTQRADRAWAALVLLHAEPDARVRALPALRGCLDDYELTAGLYLHIARTLTGREAPYREAALDALQRLMRDVSVATAPRLTAARALGRLEPRYRAEAARVLAALVTGRSGTAADWAYAAGILADWDAQFADQARQLLRAAVADDALSLRQRADAVQGLLCLDLPPT